MCATCEDAGAIRVQTIYQDHLQRHICRWDLCPACKGSRLTDPAAVADFDRCRRARAIAEQNQNYHNLRKS